MRAAPWVALALALGLTACTSDPEGEASGSTATGSATSTSAAAFAVTECPADVAAVIVGEISCGFLNVPEDRSDPGRETRVFVTRIEPPQVLHEDPILVAGTDLANLPNYGGIAPLAQRVGREVILLDTRGVGHSEPSLACPEVDEIQADVLSTATDDTHTRGLFLDAVAACHERITSSGVDPAAYNLSEMAADAVALRTELGIDEWNVASYGTASRIAVEMVRQDPEPIRSVLLDSPELPGADPTMLAVDGTRAALSAVLDACAANDRCATAYPDAATLLDRALDDLASDPVTVSMTPTSSESSDVLVDDALALRLLRGMLSDGGSSGSFMSPASVPAFLTSVVTGRVDRLSGTFATAVAGAPPYCLGYLPKCLPQHRASVGTAYSVLCHDIDPVHDAAVARGLGKDDAGFATAYGDSPYLDVCDAWPTADADTASAERVNLPVDSDVPLLAMVGAFSPYSPAPVVREGLSGLTGATLVVDPVGGHNVMGSDCLVSIRGAWLDDLELTDEERGCLKTQETAWVTDPATLVTSTPETVTTDPTTAPRTAGLEGAWESDLSRAEIAQALRAGGYAGLSRTFFATEEIPTDGIRIRTTFRDGQFTQAYRGSDGVWQVGWEGSTSTTGRRVRIIDDPSGSTDTLQWRVRGDRARLRPLTTTGSLYKGIPQMAYLWAYFAADSHRRVE